MPALIRPSEVKVIAQDGGVQVSIVLDLNINLTTSGLNVSVQAKEIEKKQETTHWAIPDFESSPKINFGKKE